MLRLTLAGVCSRDVTLGIGIELFFAPLRAEVVLVAFVLTGRRGGPFVDLHVAHVISGHVL